MFNDWQEGFPLCSDYYIYIKKYYHKYTLKELLEERNHWIIPEVHRVLNESIEKKKINELIKLWIEE